MQFINSNQNSIFYYKNIDMLETKKLNLYPSKRLLQTDTYLSSKYFTRKCFTNVIALAYFINILASSYPQLSLFYFLLIYFLSKTINPNYYLLNSITLHKQYLLLLQTSKVFFQKNQKQRKLLMFNTIYNAVIEKVKGLNPINAFIKYALDKFLNQLINDEITLQDFKGGCLNLTKIGFNVDKVNQKYLVSSPYILHSGSIGNLKIYLPAFSQISSKSIQIEVKQIVIELKPNKNFEKNFKQVMKRLQQDMMFQFQQSVPEEELADTNPMQYFRMALKQFFLNIKIKVQNIVIKVYMNNPSETTKKNQFYLMIRIPTINVHKSNTAKKTIQKDLEQIKFDIQMPQLSIHLMNEGVPVPQFSNQKFQKDDFPFKYPTIEHPKTILLFGLHDFKNLNIETDSNVPRLTLEILTDANKKKRKFTVSAITSNIQVMVDPLQIKVLTRFAHQIKQFKKIFNFVKKQTSNQSLIQTEKSVSQELTTFKRNKSSESSNDDIFSSICMSIWQPEPINKAKGASKLRKKPDIIASMLKQNADLSQSISAFDNQFKQQAEKMHLANQITHEITSDLRVTKFKKNMQIKLKVNQFYVYILKSGFEINYYRKWMSGSKQRLINKSISIPHFLFSIQNMNFEFREEEKVTSIQITELKLQNVKIFVNESKSHQNEKKINMLDSLNQNQFVDVQGSTTFYQNQKLENQKKEQNQNSISQFVLGYKDHYCIEQIIRISRKSSQNYFSDKIRKYNFLPKVEEKQDYIISKPGLRFSFNGGSRIPQIKINILQIAVSLNPEIMKQAMQIYFPVASFKKLTEAYSPLALQLAQINHNQSNKQVNKKDRQIEVRKFQMIESQYNCETQFQTGYSYSQKKEKSKISIEIEEINFGFFQSPQQNFVNLIHKYKQNPHFLDKKCFCNVCSTGLYFQCFRLQIRKGYKGQNTVDIHLNKIITGFIQLNTSKIQKLSPLFWIESIKHEKSFKIYLQKSNQQRQQNLYLSIPKISLLIEERQIINCIHLVQRQLQIIQSCNFYFRFLEASMNSIIIDDLEYNVKKIQKNVEKFEQNISFYVGEINCTFLNTDVHVRNLYFSKQSDNLSAKICTLVFSLRENVQLFLNQMKSQDLCLRQFIQKTTRYRSILDSNIIFEINDNKLNFQEMSNADIIKFFEKIAAIKMSIQFQMRKTSCAQEYNNGLSKVKQVFAKNQKFKFNKKPSVKTVGNHFSGSTIIEEEQLKQLNLSISNPICISANNICRLLEQKKYFQQLIEKVKNMQNQIVLKSKRLQYPERKNSTDSDIEKLEEMKINIQEGKINLDIRPTFIEKRNQKSKREIIFGSTRSYLQFKWETVSIEIKKRIQKIDCQGGFSLRYHFLEHQERQINTNPIFINDRQLQMLGFLRLLDLKHLKFKVQKERQLVKLNIEINQIDFKSSISTLAYLNLHFEHFTQHNLKRNFGLTVKQDQQKFHPLIINPNQQQQKQKNNPNHNNNIVCDLDSDQENQEYNYINKVKDISRDLQIYTQKSQKKRKQEAEFKDKKFSQINAQKDCQFYLQALRIKQIKFKLYSGSDFEFISCESMNQSKQKKRSKVDNSQILKYIEFRLNFLYLQVKIPSFKQIDLQCYAKIQNLQLNFSNKKKTGGFLSRWISSNKQTEQVVFPILANEGEVKILFEYSKQKKYLKLNKSSFTIGFTSQILQLLKQINRANDDIKLSGWKKIYDEVENCKKGQNKLDQNQSNLIMLYVPDNRITVRLIYQGIQILTNQTLTAPQFLLHQESSNIGKINQKVIQWVKRLLKNNITGLISGTLANSAVNLVEQILQVVKILLGFAFRGNQGV